jgi:hypothetical protein
MASFRYYYIAIREWLSGVDWDDAKYYAEAVVFGWKRQS